MNAQPQEKIKIPPEEYLEFERNSAMKHEYFDGEIFAVTGASLNHNQINFNISGELRNQLKKSTCRAFANDMRVKIQENGKYTYPDIVGVCGDIDLEDDKFDTLLNPSSLKFFQTPPRHMIGAQSSSIIGLFPRFRNISLYLNIPVL